MRVGHLGMHGLAHAWGEREDAGGAEGDCLGHENRDGGEVMEVVMVRK